MRCIGVLITLVCLLPFYLVIYLIRWKYVAYTCWRLLYTSTRPGCLYRLGPVKRTVSCCPGNKTLRTRDASDPQNSYRSVRTLITHNLAYNHGHGSKSLGDRNALRHFGTGSEVFRACFRTEVSWVRTFRYPLPQHGATAVQYPATGPDRCPAWCGDRLPRTVTNLATDPVQCKPTVLPLSRTGTDF